MQLAYRVLVASLAFMGSISLLVSGELNPVFVLPGLAMIPGYYRYIRGYAPVNRWLIAGLSLLELLVVAFDSLMVSGDFFIAVAHMTIIFQAIKSFDHREAWDPLQVYFMSMLQVVIASELTLSMAMGGVFIVFLLLFMAALVFSHFMKEGTLERVNFRAPLISVSMVALAATVIFFVSVPRVKGEIWGRKTSSGIRTAGFSEQVDFASYGRVLEDDSIVMRVELEGNRLPFYWRGQSLDFFDGIAWSDTIQHEIRVYRQDGKYVVWPEYIGPSTTQKIIIEPLDTEIVFGLGRIVSVDGSAWLINKSLTGAVTMRQKMNRRFTYTVQSAPWKDEQLHQRDRYLQVPEGMDDVKTLSLQVAGQGAAMERARGIERYLLDNYQYVLRDEEPPAGMTPVQHFLFTTKAGFCEHYATAMVLMLRLQGIPARLVTGFAGGEENAYGNYVIVRQKNAHSWVEAFIDGEWARFDPTPSARFDEARGTIFLLMDSLRMSWYRYVVGFSSRDQVRMLKAFSSPSIALPSIKGMRISLPPAILLIMVLMALAGSAWAISRYMRRRRLSIASRRYLRLRGRVKRRGGELGRDSTSGDVLREAHRLDMDIAEIEDFIQHYERARFGQGSEHETD